MSDVDIEKLRIAAGAALENGDEMHPSQVLALLDLIDKIRAAWTEQLPKHEWVAELYRLQDEDGRLRQQLASVTAARDAIQSDSNAALERYRREGAGLRAERDRLRDLVQHIDETLRVPAAEYVPAIQDAFKLIDLATNNGTHVSLQAQIDDVTADRDRLREGLREACDIAEAALHPGKGAIARPRIAELRLLTTREAKP